MLSKYSYFLIVLLLFCFQLVSTLLDSEYILEFSIKQA